MITKFEDYINENNDNDNTLLTKLPKNLKIKDYFNPDDYTPLTKLPKNLEDATNFKKARFNA